MTTLLILAGLVLAALAATALVLVLRLEARRRRQRTTRDAMAEHNQREHDDRLLSLKMITLATLSGDCDLSEGCLRVRQLMQNYPGLRDDAAHAPIEALYDRIRHFDVGEARRALGAAERDRQDRERLELEGRHRAEVLASFRVLREQVAALEGSSYDVDVATGVVSVPAGADAASADAASADSRAA